MCKEVYERILHSSPIPCGWFIALTVINYLYGIAITSWMVQEHQTNFYRKEFTRRALDVVEVVGERTDSWTTVPFVDVAVFDATEYLNGCPQSHPDELIYEVWLGTTFMCDCLQREQGQGRNYFLDQACSRGKNRPHNSPDCINEIGRSPIVQSIVKGARYCGRRGGKPFATTIRPSQNTATGGYSCPQGTVACNPDFLKDAKTAEFAICRPQDSSEADYCPITSVAFSVDSLATSERSKYTEVKLMRKGLPIEGRSLFFSKQVAQHAIESFRISESVPCKNPKEVGSGVKQSFFFTELAKKQRGCTEQDMQYQPVKRSFNLNEHEFQFENGVLNSLEKALHYTYSFFPDDSIKKQISMTVYQRPTFNWKLTCDANPNTTRQKALEEMSSVGYKDSIWMQMFDSFDSLGVAAICIQILFFWVFPYVSILTAILLIKPLSLMWYTYRGLLKRHIVDEMPVWINECFEKDQGLDTSSNLDIIAEANMSVKAIGICVLVFMIFTLINTLFSVVGCFQCCCCPKKTTDSAVTDQVELAPDSKPALANDDSLREKSDVTATPDILANVVKEKTEGDLKVLDASVNGDVLGETKK